MGRQSNRRGRRGEEEAALWLQKQGAEILERRWRCPAGEVDVIAKMDGFLCFVEVKARRTLGFGAPEEAVGRDKRRRLVGCAEHYLCRHPEMQALQPRFDVVSVILGEREQVRSLTYLSGAFSCDDL